MGRLPAGIEIPGFSPVRARPHKDLWLGGPQNSVRGHCTQACGAAMRKNVKGFLIAPVPVLWNMEITK